MNILVVIKFGNCPNFLIFHYFRSIFICYQTVYLFSLSSNLYYPPYPSSNQKSSIQSELRIHFSGKKSSNHNDLIVTSGQNEQIRAKYVYKGQIKRAKYLSQSNYAKKDLHFLKSQLFC